MAYFTEAEVRGQAERVNRTVRKSAGQVLAADLASAEDGFDVFLSHSSAEPEEILLGIKSLLDEAGMSVYVDRYSDPQLSLNKVTRSTAALLRRRMKQSQALLYVYSPHSTKSRWMPWELGYFDGLRGKVGVIPVTLEQEEDFKGEEYLSLYPYVDRALSTSEVMRMWINRVTGEYARLDSWVRGKEKLRKRS